MGTVSDKLTYLNTTKTQIRERINDLGQDLDEEDTFRSYAEALENIYEDYPKVTAENVTEATLNNTKAGRMKIGLKGNTLQNGTPTPDSPIPIQNVSGNNTIKVQNFNIWDEEWELGGINSTTGQDYSSTATIRSKNYISVIPNTQYYFKNGTDKFWVLAYDKSKNFLGYFTGDSSSIANTVANAPLNCYYMRFQCRSEYGTTYNNDICINVSNTGLNGTYMAHEEQNLAVNLKSKNLFDGELELGGINVNNGELTTDNNRKRSKNFIKVKPNTTYTITKELEGGYFWIVGYNSNKVGISDGNIGGYPCALGQTSGTTTVFTTTATTEYIKFYNTNLKITEKTQLELRKYSSSLRTIL